jgi:hypothetical protein
MKPDRAIRLVNFVPMADGLHARSGQRLWTKGLSGKVEAMLSYAGDKQFACAGGIIYEVRRGLNIPQVTGNFSDRWLSDTCLNHGGRYLVAANGIDPVKAFDGSTWRDCAITGVDSKNLACPVYLLNRVFFYEVRTQTVWYLEPGAFEGPAYPLPLDARFHNPAPIVGIGAVAGADGGRGPNDQLAIVTGWGEVALFGGTDPDNAESWGHVNTWSTGYPLGWRPLATIGGELALITNIGVISIPKMVSQSKSDRADMTLTEPIKETYAKWIGYDSSSSWQVCESVADRGVVLLNLPDESPLILANGAWGETDGMKATCWMDNGSYTFRGTQDGEVWQYGFGSHDEGQPIYLLSVSAYQRIGKGRRVKILRARPNMRSARIKPHISFMADYKALPKDWKPPLRPAPNNGPLWNWPFSPKEAVPFTNPEEVDTWDWQMSGGEGHALSYVFAASTKSPLLLRGIDVLDSTGGQR